MGFLNKKTSWTNMEFGLIKICIVSIGIALGIWLYPWLHDYSIYFFLLYLATGLFILLPLWFRKMKEKQD